MTAQKFISIIAVCALTLTALVSAQPAQASHSWGNYHWARTANPFTLQLGDNVTSTWDSYLQTTSSDWSTSSVLDTTIVPGTTTAKRCQPRSGRVEVCNSKYGRNGWLGIAQIWISGEHITQGITKLNDTYFSTASYNTPAWKNLVMCQEVGHLFGLDHQDENFGNANLNTCMDYTNSPDSNQHPNAHDYMQLESIYAHLDGFTTILSGTSRKPFGQFVAAGTLEALEDRAEWGRTVRDNGSVAVFEKDLGQGNKVYTFTIWADGDHTHN